MTSRRSPLQVLSSLAVAVASFASCTSSTEGGSPGVGASLDASPNDSAVGDAASPNPAVPDAASVDASAETSSACSGGDPALVDGLTKAMGLWRWSAQISGSTETPVDACDGSLHYRVGPELFVAPSTVNGYAACAIAQGGTVPVSAGRVNPPCADIGCSGGKMGLVWSSAKSGAVYELDANGKPKGAAAFLLTVRPSVSLPGYDLIWSGVSGIGGYVMSGPDLGDTVVLSCH
ncbi:MAG: hypothetical protein IPG50_17195 [Myxococcales bacterium]|nr:hypothetical protein [Myxococcales bacterium]